MNPSTQTLPQNKEARIKSYRKWLKDDVRSMLKNFEEIVKSCKVKRAVHVLRMTKSELEAYEIQVRSANIIRAAESLLKLVAEIKQYIIIDDFPAVSEAICHNSEVFRTMQEESDQKLLNLRDDIVADLHQMEQEYYTSIYKC